MRSFFFGSVRNTCLGCSGIGTNLKVGAPARSESGGTPIFLVVPGNHLLALKAQLVVFGERFLDGQYSLVSFLVNVILLTVPPVPSHL